VLAGEITDEVGGGEDGSSVDELHLFGYILAGGRDSSAVALTATARTRGSGMASRPAGG
jgi:hypothetical protein